MTRIRAVRPASILLVIAFLAGCAGGGPSRDEYVEEVRAAVIEANGAIVKRSAAIARTRKVEAARERAARLNELLGETADRLEGVEAPEDARAPHAELVGGIRQAGQDAVALAAKAKEKTLRPLDGFASDLLAAPGATRIRAAVQRLSEAGYDLESQG